MAASTGIKVTPIVVGVVGAVLTSFTIGLTVGDKVAAGEIKTLEREIKVKAAEIDLLKGRPCPEVPPLSSPGNTEPDPSQRENRERPQAAPPSLGVD
jgi:hypothetical protein